MNRLTKRFIFCNAAGNGDTNKGKAETNMRRMLAMALAILMMTALLSGAQAGVPSGVEDGVLTVAMECNYAPYNWSQSDDSNGAVPISGSNEYANGYDVMMAKKL